MTGEQWSANSVPTSFVETTVKAAREELDQEADGRREIQGPARRCATPSARSLTAAEDRGEEPAASAAEANDRPAVAREVGRLAALQGELRGARRSGTGADRHEEGGDRSRSASSPASAASSTWGNLATSAQAGAVFRFQLLWALLLGTLLVIFLVEMSGRFAAVTRQALPDAIRAAVRLRLLARSRSPS